MNSSWSTFVLIGLMVVAFYFLLIRPQRKRQQAQQKTMDELSPGTRVLLGSGVFGTIVAVGAKQATLEVAPGVELTVLKQAIARVVRPGDEYSEPEVYEDAGAEEPDGPAAEPVADEASYPNDEPTTGREPRSSKE